MARRRHAQRRRFRGAAPQGEREAVAAAAPDPYAGTVVGRYPDAFTPFTEQSMSGYSRLRQGRAVRASIKAMESNPTYERAAELHSDFIVGEGFRWDANDEDVQAFADALMGDDINAIDAEIFDMVTAKTVLGNQCYSVFGGDDGFIRLGVLDAQMIVGAQPDPADVRVHTAVYFQFGPGDPTALPVIRKNKIGQWVGHFATRGRRMIPLPPPLPGMEGFLGVFFLPGKRIQGDQLGRPEFLTGLDFADIGNEVIFEGLEALRAKLRVLFDVTVKGGASETKTRIAEVQAAGTPPPLSVNVHNEAEEWKTLSFDVASGEIDALGKMNFRKECDAYGLMPYMLGDSDGLNGRAVGNAMSEPVLRGMQRRQQRWVLFLQRFIAFGIAWAQSKGKLQGKSEEATRVVVLGDPVRDSDKKSELEQVQLAQDILDAAERAARVTEAEARRIARAEMRGIAWKLEDDEDVNAELDAKQAENRAGVARMQESAARRYGGAGRGVPQDQPGAVEPPSGSRPARAA